MAHRPVGGVTGGVGGTTGVCEFVTINPESASPEIVDVYPCGTLVSLTV